MFIYVVFIFQRDLNDVIVDQMSYIDEQNTALGEVSDRSCVCLRYFLKLIYILLHGAKSLHYCIY